jgi:hypothetical protein
MRSIRIAYLLPGVLLVGSAWADAPEVTFTQPDIDIDKHVPCHFADDEVHVQIRDNAKAVAKRIAVLQLRKDLRPGSKRWKGPAVAAIAGRSGAWSKRGD